MRYRTADLLYLGSVKLISCSASMRRACMSVRERGPQFLIVDERLASAPAAAVRNTALQF